MKPYRDLGVERKMQLMTLLICGAVLLVAVLALFTFQVLNFKYSFQRDNMTLATIIAYNSTAAMQFKDEQAAYEAISSLKVKPGVISASLTLPDGTQFAQFGQTEDAPLRPQFPPPGESRFVGGQLLLTEPVKWKGEVVGTLYLRSDYHQTFATLLKFYGLVIAGVVIVSIFLGVSLSHRLSGTIIDPVLELARTAQIVGKLKDYSLRALVDERGDELGILTRAFNEMLNHIQTQDAALNVSQEKLQTLLNSMQALINSIDGIVWERSPESFLFTFVSRQSETILGYTPEAWLNEPDFWASKLDPQDAAKTVKTVANLAAQGKSYLCEYRMLAADGRTVWMRESGMVIFENGRPIAVRGILLDITRQKLDAEQLDKLNRQLINTSRQAGMADVATGVLHNVGNVLNSVSVATSKVGERLQRSKIPNLRRATTMLRDKNGRLAEFLTEDPQGKILPDYLNTVAEQLAEEQEELLAKDQIRRSKRRTHEGDRGHATELRQGLRRF
jgi:PAS domain S-box-containing protein